MKQLGFFDLSRRYESLDAKADPLAALNKLIPWRTSVLGYDPRWKLLGSGPSPRPAKVQPGASH
jgi:hypothetical protein